MPRVLLVCHQVLHLLLLQRGSGSCPCASVLSRPDQTQVPPHTASCPSAQPRYAVVSASAGWQHCLVVTAIGSLYSFGAGVNGQLGHGDDVLHVDWPRQVTVYSGAEAQPRVASVSAGVCGCLCFAEHCKC